MAVVDLEQRYARVTLVALLQSRFYAFRSLLSVILPFSMSQMLSIPSSDLDS
jgi:hypothetical protein